MTLAQLRKLAESATKGPWNNLNLAAKPCKKVLCASAAKVNSLDYENLPACRGEIAATLSWNPSKRSKEHAEAVNNASYIAAMNPSTALRMIELLERAKKEFELMCAYFEHDRQVVLHKNDIVPDAKKWLKDLEEL